MKYLGSVIKNIASGFSMLISCLIKLASPYPLVGYKVIELSINPVLSLVSEDKSNRLPCSGWLIAPPIFTQLKCWAVFSTNSRAIVATPECTLISSQISKIFFLSF